MNKNLTPPTDLISFHNSSDPSRGESYARLKINPIINWQADTLIKEYGKDIKKNTLELLEFSLLSSWQQVNFLTQSPRDDLSYPDYSVNFLPCFLANIKGGNFGSHKEDVLFIRFLINRSIAQAA